MKFRIQLLFNFFSFPLLGSINIMNFHFLLQRVEDKMSQFRKNKQKKAHLICSSRLLTKRFVSWAESRRRWYIVVQLLTWSSFTFAELSQSEMIVLMQKLSTRLNTRWPESFLTGIKVKYDISKPPNQRVVSLSLLCTDCRVPKYEPLVPEKIYTVVMPSYIVDGGDGFDMIKNGRLKHNTGRKSSKFLTSLQEF